MTTAIDIIGKCVKNAVKPLIDEIIYNMPFRDCDCDCESGMQVIESIALHPAVLTTGKVQACVLSRVLVGGCRTYHITYYCHGQYTLLKKTADKESAEEQYKRYARNSIVVYRRD